ncbi:MAG: hypothetical protein WBB19_03230 [Desulforhopalus sp.]
MGRLYLDAKSTVLPCAGMCRFQCSGWAFNSPAPAVVKTILFVVAVLMAIQATQLLWVKIKLLRDVRSNPKNGKNNGGRDWMFVLSALVVEWGLFFCSA